MYGCHHIYWVLPLGWFYNTDSDAGSWMPTGIQHRMALRRPGMCSWYGVSPWSLHVITGNDGQALSYLPGLDYWLKQLLGYMSGNKSDLIHALSLLGCVNLKCARNIGWEGWQNDAMRRCIQCQCRRAKGLLKQAFTSLSLTLAHLGLLVSFGKGAVGATLWFFLRAPIGAEHSLSPPPQTNITGGGLPISSRWRMVHRRWSIRLNKGR